MSNKTFLNDLSPVNEGVFTSIFVRRLGSTFNLVAMCYDVILFVQLIQVTISTGVRIRKVYLLFFTPELFENCQVIQNLVLHFDKHFAVCKQNDVTLGRADNFKLEQCVF